MTVLDALDVTPLADDTYGAYAVGDLVRIREEVGTVFRIREFRRFDDRPDEVDVFGGQRRKDEWITAAFHTFHADRIIEKLRMVQIPGKDESHWVARR